MRDTDLIFDMDRDEIKDLLLKMWEKAQDRNLGSGEAELDFIESVTDLILGEK